MNRIPYLAMFALLCLAAIAFSPVAQAQTQMSGRPMHPRPMAPPNAALAAPAQTNAPATARAYSTVPGKKTSAGEQFFIVASLDLQKSQLLLKHPTEVTLLVKTTDQTKFLDDSGRPIKLSDLRSGDTVWVTLTGTADAPTTLKVRKGQMTVADLHRYYLDYPPIQ